MKRLFLGGNKHGQWLEVDKDSIAEYKKMVYQRSFPDGSSSMGFVYVWDSCSIFDLFLSVVVEKYEEKK